ncbi:MAG: hypothetical protein KGD64_14730 [Candidatus Heimdallarchaeota archaeon]|nr:hypothetical protein [Candidatus Heimdallarchaeota archaeon]
MARNRVIYQSEALYVSSGVNATTSGGHTQLERVQSANYNFTINRQDVNQYGQLARLDSIVLEPPTVALDYSYYLTDGFNERALGFYVQNPSSAAVGNFASGHLADGSGRNLFVTAVAEGFDAQGKVGDQTQSVIGLGNAYLSNYGLELSVGAIPTVSVSMECANINSTVTPTVTGNAAITGIATPGVDISAGTPLSGKVQLKPAITGESTVTALRPGDITVDITSFDDQTISLLGGGDSINIQSASLSLPLSRSPIQRLGSKFPFARVVDFPVAATLSINAILTDITARNLAGVIDDTAKKNVSLTLKGTDGNTKMVYTLKNCVLDSESFSSSIGSNKSVDLTFSTQIGGPNDPDNGIFVSGANSSVPYV